LSDQKILFSSLLYLFVVLGLIISFRCILNFVFTTLYSCQVVIQLIIPLILIYSDSVIYVSTKYSRHFSWGLISYNINITSISFMLMDKTNILIIMLKTLKMIVYIENMNIRNFIL
jgi:hypothetical protein